MDSRFFKAVAVGVVFFMASCINNPASLSTKGNGNAEIWASVSKPKSSGVLAKTTATTWDSLIVVVSAEDMDTMRIASKFTSSDPYNNLAIENIPAGKKRSFEVFTKSKDNVIIHVSSIQTSDIAASEKKILDFKLVPTKGSIYIDLTNIPTAVKHICATFSAFSVCEDRSTKLYMSIDNVPDKTKDTLVIQGTDTAGTILYRSALWLAYSVCKDTSVSSGFYRVTTGTSLTVSTQIPASTVVSGSVGSSKTIRMETGALMISEIMYNANDSEYVELYNPKDVAFIDSLILEIDGTNRVVGIVSIAPKSFYVIGRKSLPWTDTSFAVSSALDLSASGNWISVKTKAICDTVLDWVAFTGGSNAQEWPNLSTSKKSILCDSLTPDATYNNYGRNWKVAQTSLVAAYPGIATSQFGTPGAKGF